MSKKELEKISISDELMEKIEEHCFSEVSHEVGGFFVGIIGEDKTEIKGVIPSTKAQSQQTSLTFTHEAWDEAYQALAKDFPDLNLVGWYHSHPGFGVFMSEYDSFIQQNFFGTKGQLALVVDPLAGRRGWFKWGNEKIKELHQEDTDKDGIGGEAADYTPIPVSKSSGNVIGAVPATKVITVILIMVLSGLIGFLSGQSGKSEDLQFLENERVSLTQRLSQLSAALFGELFYPVQESDPAAQRFYVRYALSDNELESADYLAIVANKFAVSPEELKKINPGLDEASVAPEYLNVPISGWRTVPPAIVKEEEVAQESETPTVTASPTPSASKSDK